MHRLIFILLLINSPSVAQSVSTRLGARAAGMGNAAFTLTDPSSLFHNVASLGFLTDPSVFFSYEILPALPGADRRAAAVNWPLSFGTLAAGAFRFGDDLYSEQFLTAGFSHRIDHTALGIKTNFLQYRADGFGPQTALTIDVAGLTQLTPAWTIGAGIFNVGQAGLTPEDPLPVVFVAATSWKSPEGAMLVAEAEKQLDMPLQVKAGLEVTLFKKMFARAGIGTNPLILSGGVGAKTTRLQFDFASSYQSVLGLSYQASATYRIQKNKKS
ncbi:MAG: hypothetical protein JNN04_13510 [Cyclobacteriaceae bacterium]|nr:hypothetical protein [Cyclobacteriaceae bacterium]